MPNTPRKYRAFAPIDLPHRQWPQRTITRAPIWMSTDLRDGNQSLFEPMPPARKLQMFELLCRIGFKEIEVAFPAASQLDFDFVRQLIEEDRIPDDVTIEVLTQAREDLIGRTFESLRGARRAIVHVYNATAPIFRCVVFQMDRAGVQNLAVRSAALIRQLAEQHRDTAWTFQYSPEVFSGTELDFALEVSDAVMDVWEPSPSRKAILNLPATVEMSTPNVYADQIEWMHTHLARRDSIVLSVHPHNDRGCAVAAAELAVLAGADRIEGCLLGNGERTGNVDLITLGLNLYTQGVDPGLDFSDLPAIARVAETCTQLPIHPRHPYVGDLVFTAFSGSHQDAIRKGLAAQAHQAPDSAWAVPYLPIDPADIGRNYDSVVRVNSQSGKGGIAFLLETHYGITLPRRLQVAFSAVVQAQAEAQGGEISAAELWALLQAQYANINEPLAYASHTLHEQDQRCMVHLNLTQNGHPLHIAAIGKGPLDAACRALSAHFPGLNTLRIDDYTEQALNQGASAPAFACIELACQGVNGSRFGIAQSDSLSSASLQALVSGVNQLIQAQRASSIPRHADPRCANMGT